MAKLAQVVNPNLELFPILSRFPPMATDSPLTGIARLAAASSPAGEGHRMELRSLQVRSVLNRSCFPARTQLCLEHQSLPWLRVCLPLLLCPLYPRVHGVAAGGLRTKNLYQTECSLATGAGIEAGSPGRGDCPGHGDRSLSTR